MQEAPSAYMDLHISAAVMLQRACGRRLETTGRLQRGGGAPPSVSAPLRINRSPNSRAVVRRPCHGNAGTAPPDLRRDVVPSVTLDFPAISRVLMMLYVIHDLMMQIATIGEDA